MVTNTIDRIIEKLLLLGDRRTLGICGLGGTGKTTLCTEIQRRHPTSTAIIEIDWYLTHTSKERRARVLEAIDSNSNDLAFWKDPVNWYDWQLFVVDLDQLRSRGSLKRSGLWRQSSGEKDLEVSLSLATSGVIICDGIYLLHEEVRAHLNQTVLLKTTPESALARSIQRDHHRNPKNYQDFKSLVTAEYDIPYFEKYQDLASEVVII
jgi:uridine kinase